MTFEIITDQKTIDNLNYHRRLKQEQITERYRESMQQHNRRYSIDISNVGGRCQLSSIWMNFKQLKSVLKQAFVKYPRDRYIYTLNYKLEIDIK